jgi:hypothetical protein
MSTSITEANDQTVYRAGSTANDGAKHRIRRAQPDLEFTAVAHSGAVVWDDGAANGMFLIPLGAPDDSIAIYIPENKTQNVTISATDGVNTVSYSLTTFGTIPLQPQVNFESELDQETKMKFARDRTRYFREDGSEEQAWTLAFDAREQDAKAELLAFWRAHRKVVPFWIIDTENDTMNKVWFVAPYKWVTAGGNRFNMIVAVRGVFSDLEAYEADVIDPGEPPVGGDSVLYEGESVEFEANTVVHLSAGEPDLEAPTAPSGVVQTSNSTSSFTFDWTPGTDNVGITGSRYRLDGGAPVNMGATKPFTVSGLLPNDSWSLEVQHYDAAGNSSAWSTAITASTDPLVFDDAAFNMAGAIIAGYAQPVRSSYSGFAYRVTIGGTPTDITYANVPATAANDYPITHVYDVSGNAINLTVIGGTPTLSLDAHGRPGIHLPAGATIGNLSYNGWNGSAHMNIFIAGKLNNGAGSGYLLCDASTGRYIYKAKGAANRQTQVAMWFGAESSYNQTARHNHFSDHIRYEGGAGSDAARLRMKEDGFEHTRDASSGAVETSLSNSTGFAINGTTAGAAGVGDMWLYGFALLPSSVSDAAALAVEAFHNQLLAVDEVQEPQRLRPIR